MLVQVASEALYISANVRIRAHPPLAWPGFKGAAAWLWTMGQGLEIPDLGNG